MEALCFLRATSPTSGPHSLPLTPSDDSSLLSLLQPHRPLCFLLSIPDIFPPQGFCSGCSCCLERLFPRSHPFKSFLKHYLSEAYQTIPLKMAKLSSCTLLAPSLLCFPRHLCRICYLSFLYHRLSSLECEFLTCTAVFLPPTTVTDNSKCVMRGLTQPLQSSCLSRA